MLSVKNLFNIYQRDVVIMLSTKV